MSSYITGRRQRLKWRIAKRAWRAKHITRSARKLLVFLGQRDISDFITNIEAAPGLSYVDVTMRLVCEEKLREWLLNRFNTGKLHLRIYMDGRMVYSMYVLFKNLICPRTNGQLAYAVAEFVSTGFVSTGKVQRLVPVPVPGMGGVVSMDGGQYGE